MVREPWFRGRGGTIAISWGKSGGIYLTRLPGWSRLCVGRIAFTLIGRDLDAVIRELLDAIDIRTVGERE